MSTKLKWKCLQVSDTGLPREFDEPLGTRGLTNEGSWLRARMRAAGSVREDIFAVGAVVACVAIIWITKMYNTRRTRNHTTIKKKSSFRGWDGFATRNNKCHSRGTSSKNKFSFGRWPNCVWGRQNCQAGLIRWVYSFYLFVLLGLYITNTLCVIFVLFNKFLRVW